MIHLLLLTSTVLSTSSLIAQAPPNDACADAIPVTCGQVIGGNTTEATDDAEAFDCFTGIQAPGIWYSFVGTGEAITLTTCTNFLYDTRINVYNGTCSELNCVAGNDDGGGCELGSTVGFLSTEGTNYLILLQGYQGAVGEFELTVSCGPVTNDYCAGALPIACNESLEGNTLDATPDLGPFCGTGIQAAGVWYTFTGISDPVLISTCESFDYDTRINVYAGSCDEFTCVAGNDDTPGVGNCSTVNFVPDPEEQYYILVQGYDGAVGNFMLELVCQTCGTPSEIFATASDVSATVYWQSLNPGATYTIEYGPLGFEPGTGELATGTVSGTEASGTITGLTAGTEYAFYLTEECGPGDESLTVGAFLFTTLDAPPPANAGCGGALPISCGGSVEGDTQLSFFQPFASCGSGGVTAPGLWYTFTGTGETVTLSTCNAAEYDTKINVYAAPCEDPVCVAGVDDAPDCEGNTTEVTFPTASGTVYLVLVHGYTDAAGPFTLSMSCEPACSPVAANDECAAAEALEVFNFGACAPSSGSNECAFATAVPNPPCDPFAAIVDVWYSFNTGNLSEVTLFLGQLSALEVNAAVYQECGSLNYIGCETEIEGEWVLTDLAPNTTYYVRIWNAGGAQAGTFAICLEGDLSTSVADQAPVALTRFWPNPAHDLITISDLQATGLTVFDAQGRAVRSLNTNGMSTVSLDIQDLAPGLYSVHGFDTGASLIGRFAKE